MQKGLKIGQLGRRRCARRINEEISQENWLNKNHVGSEIGINNKSYFAATIIPFIK